MVAGYAPLITHEQRDEWEAYSVKNQDWIETSEYLNAVHPEHRDALHGTIQDHEHDRRRLQGSSISPTIYKYENGQKVPEVSQPGQTLAPFWQLSPADAGAVNVNLLSDTNVREVYEKMSEVQAAVLSTDIQIGDMVSPSLILGCLWAL